MKKKIFAFILLLICFSFFSCSDYGVPIREYLYLVEGDDTDVIYDPWLLNVGFKEDNYSWQKSNETFTITIENSSSMEVLPQVNAYQTGLKNAGKIISGIFSSLKSSNIPELEMSFTDDSKTKIEIKMKQDAIDSLKNNLNNSTIYFVIDLLYEGNKFQTNSNLYNQCVLTYN